MGTSGETKKRPEQAATKPSLSSREEEALRLLREIARLEAERPAASRRPNRINQYLLPQ